MSDARSPSGISYYREECVATDIYTAVRGPVGVQLSTMSDGSALAHHEWSLGDGHNGKPIDSEDLPEHVRDELDRVLLRRVKRRTGLIARAQRGEEVKIP